MILRAWNLSVRHAQDLFRRRHQVAEAFELWDPLEQHLDDAFKSRWSHSRLNGGRKRANLKQGVRTSRYA
jgi:hypothetical protein